MAARLSKEETRLVISALSDSIEKADRRVVSTGNPNIIVDGQQRLRQSALEKANRMRRLRARLTANLEALDR